MTATETLDQTTVPPSDAVAGVPATETEPAPFDREAAQRALVSLVSAACSIGDFHPADDKCLQHAIDHAAHAEAMAEQLTDIHMAAMLLRSDLSACDVDAEIGVIKAARAELTRLRSQVDETSTALAALRRLHVRAITSDTAYALRESLSGLPEYDDAAPVSDTVIAATRVINRLRGEIDQASADRRELAMHRGRAQAICHMSNALLAIREVCAKAEEHWRQLGLPDAGLLETMAGIANQALDKLGNAKDASRD